MDQLRNCPFCGGKAAVCDIKKPSVNGWVGCQMCRCFIDWVKDGKSLAIAAWNRRAGQDHSGDANEMVAQPENAPLTTTWETSESCPKCNEHLSRDWSFCPECGRVTDWAQNEPLTPCDLCRYTPPSSGGKKPCAICPAIAKQGEAPHV